MSKQTLHCKMCKNKIGEVEEGVSTIRYKQREVAVNGAICPYHLRIVCEKCGAKTCFEVCTKETIQEE